MLASFRLKVYLLSSIEEKVLLFVQSNSTPVIGPVFEPRGDTPGDFKFPFRFEPPGTARAVAPGPVFLVPSTFTLGDNLGLVYLLFPGRGLSPAL